MKIIKEYLFHPNVRVRVIKGDVTKISADVCICGRARKLLQELRTEHEFAFKKFWESISSRERSIEIASTENLPWKKLIRINYRPGPKNPYRFSRNHIPHSIGLAQDIVFVIDNLITFHSINNILMLSLSMRNPDTVMAAMTSAIKVYLINYNAQSTATTKFISVVDKDDPSQYISWFDKPKTLFHWYSEMTEYE